MKNSIKKCRAWAAAIAVFAFGFGMMNILWLLYSNGRSVVYPGLYDYYAATIGDGICLPVMTFCGIRCMDCIKITKHRKIRRIVVGAVCITAVCIQIAWLLDDNIKTNWTIPEVHQFNFAGWYHAVFFVAMFSLMADIIMKMWFASFAEQERRQMNKLVVYYAIFWLFFSLFLYMHAIDDYVEKYGLFKTFLIIFLFGTLASSLFWIRAGRSVRKIVIIFAGQILSVGMAMIIFFMV